MVPHKHVVLIVKGVLTDAGKTPSRNRRRPDMARIKAAAGPNVEILGSRPFDVLHDHLQRARAFVSAADKDFDISIIEAQACGMGGVLESVIGLPDERPQVYCSENKRSSR